MSQRNNFIMKQLLFMAFLIGAPLLIADNKKEQIAKLHEAIKKCRLKGLQGTYDPRICAFRDKFIAQQLGARENFMIVYGATGNGKTMMAEHITSECTASFTELDNNKVNDAQGLLYLQTKLNEVEKLTQSGKKVLLLLDEFDSIIICNNLAINQCLYDFLKRNQSNQYLLIIATSNYYERFNEEIKNAAGFKVLVISPDAESRNEILIHYAKEAAIQLPLSIVNHIVQKTEGMSRRGLKNIIVQIRQQYTMTNKQLTINDLNKIIEHEQKAEFIYKETIGLGTKILYATCDVIEGLAYFGGHIISAVISDKLVNSK